MTPLTADPPLVSFITGGTLPPDASSYIERRADRELLDALLAGEYCYILHSRQMGKSSLSVRTIRRLKEQGIRTAFLDLTRIGAHNVSAEQWYAGLSVEMGRSLELRSEFIRYGKEHPELAPVQRFFAAIRDLALGADETPLVVFVDEIDAVRSLSFAADEFFAAIRACYNARTEEPALRRLTFCLVGSATPADLIVDSRISPFNIGRRIELTDFTPEEAAPLAYGLLYRQVAKTDDGRSTDGGGGTVVSGRQTDTVRQPEDDVNNPAGPAAHDSPLITAILHRVLHWTGGHPYLTQRLCAALAAAPSSAVVRPSSVDEVCSRLFFSDGSRETDDNLAFVRNRLLKSDVDVAALLHLYGKMLAGRRVPDDEANPLVAVLKLSGVAKAEGGRLRIRNRIYERAFDPAWVREQMPDAELRRQREAYRRGVVRAVSLSGLVVFALACLAIVSYRSTLRALSAEAAIRAQSAGTQHLLYLSDMNLLQREWEADNVGHALDLLRDTADYPGRNFEWGYWRRIFESQGRSTLLKGHSGQISALAFSPDGKRLLSASLDQTARLWDVDQPGEGVILTGHTSFLTSVAFSPSGRLLATGDGSGQVIVRNTATNQEICRLHAHTSWVTAIAFSPAEDRILTSSYDMACWVWTIPDGKRAGKVEWKGDRPNAMVVLRDGRHVGMANEDLTGRLLDLKTRKQVKTWPQTGWAYALAESPRGDRIISGCDDGSVTVAEVASGRPAMRLAAHHGSVVAVRYSPDGSRFVTVGYDGFVKCWDARTGALLTSMRMAAGYITAAAVSPDGSQVAVGVDDKTIRLKKIEPDAGPLTLRPHSGEIWGVAPSPDGTRVALGCSSGPAQVWDVKTGRKVRDLGVAIGTTGAIAWSPDGKKIAACNGPTGRVFDAVSGRELAARRGFGTVAFLPDNETLALSWYDPIQSKEGALWNSRTGQEGLWLKGHTDGLISLAVSPDGKRIVSGSYDQTARIWDADTGRELRVLRGHSHQLQSVAFSPDGKKIVTGSLDKTARVWDAGTGAELMTLRGHTQMVLGVAFSPDGRRIVTGSKDNTAKVWDVATGRETLTLRGHTKAVYAVAWMPKGNRIVTASLDGTAIVWSAD